jgi:hypothetical protein
MKLQVMSFFLKSAVIGPCLAAIALGASIVLTDRSPLTLPARAQQWLMEHYERPLAPRRNAPGRPLIGFPVISPHDADSEMRDDYFVVGVEWNGECRAYPLNMLSRPDHHVLDDTLGGEPIAVTWCGLCQSPMVYSRRVAHRTVTLFVAGGLHGENMVMRDMETGSEWPQMLGRAISGPLAGESLDQMASVWTDWKTWRTEHPQTTVVDIPQTVDYYRHDSIDSTTGWEQRYFSNLQWGLVRNGKAMSWPLREFARHAAVNDRFAGLPLVIVFDRATATISAFVRRIGNSEPTFRLEAEGLVDDETSTTWDPVSGRAMRGALTGSRLKPVPGVVSHLRAWRTLHPDTEFHSVGSS